MMKQQKIVVIPSKEFMFQPLPGFGGLFFFSIFPSVERYPILLLSLTNSNLFTKPAVEEGGSAVVYIIDILITVSQLNQTEGS